MTPHAENEDQLRFKPDRRGGRRPDAPVRRRYERLYGPCVALVRGVDTGGEAFTESTVLDNVSAGGLQVKLRHDVALGARLFIVFAFSSVALRDVPAPRVAAHGEVRRVETDGDPTAHGVAVQFRHHRFL